jgi:hypothetical protein
MHDELMERLANARPNTPTDLLQPNAQLLEEVVATRPGQKHRLVTPLRLSAVAGVAAALVAVLMVVPTSNTNDAPRALNMRAIVESTSTALSSGRAHVHFRSESDRAGMYASSSDFVVEFNGDDRSMAGTVDPGDERGAGAFPIANKVIDGRFYLEDGTRWIEDTAANLSGADVFSVDPRNFLAGVAQQAAFEDRGRATVAGVTTRHLVATKVQNIPAFNLGLGPTDAKDDGLEKFEVWVDDDDVVRALLVESSRQDKTYPLAQTRISRGPDGSLQKSLDPATLGEPVIVTTTSTYKVEFTDLGAAIDIVAPANAPKIEGKG